MILGRNDSRLAADSETILADLQQFGRLAKSLDNQVLVGELAHSLEGGDLGDRDICVDKQKGNREVNIKHWITELESLSKKNTKKEQSLNIHPSLFLETNSLMNLSEGKLESLK